MLPRRDFPRAKRLRSGTEIQSVTRRGERHQDSMFTIYAYPNSLDHARLGVTVSRRVSLRANHRNRIKRMIRESFRSNQEPLGGLDIVVVARAASDTASAEILRGSLLGFWSKVSKSCRPSS